jgi:hypothetical protein
MPLWHEARAEELRTIPLDSKEWWLLFHEGDKLVGWCTQINASGVIRENEIPQLRDFPALDNTGPYATWLAEIRTQKPHIFAYVANLEQIRLALLWQVSQ